MYQLTIQDFRGMAQKVKEREPDVSHWTFGEYVSRSLSVYWVVSLMLVQVDS